MSAPTCDQCNGTGSLNDALESACPCTQEQDRDGYDRALAERDQLRAHNTVLEKMLAEERQAKAVLMADRERLLAQRLRLLDAVGERAAALQSAHNLEGAAALMALVREVADG